jgi:hypothetical protein
LSYGECYDVPDLMQLIGLATSPTPTVVDVRQVLDWKLWSAPITKQCHGSMSCRGFLFKAVDGEDGGIVDVVIQVARHGRGDKWNPYKSLYFKDDDIGVFSYDSFFFGVVVIVYFLCIR